jgi:hypothetical protein
MKFKFTKKEGVSDEETNHPVVGAGHVRLGRNAKSICGGRAGISIGCSWGRFGADSGGVLSREHAKELADRIYELLDDCDMSEEEYYNKNISGYKWDPTNV